MVWKMWCFTLQSMGRTNHELPVQATQNVQTHLKSTVLKDLDLLSYVTVDVQTLQTSRWY